MDRLTPKKEYEKEQSPENWKIKMLYDGDCPLCMREVLIPFIFYAHVVYLKSCFLDLFIMFRYVV